MWPHAQDSAHGSPSPTSDIRLRDALSHFGSWSKPLAETSGYFAGDQHRDPSRDGLTHRISWSGIRQPPNPMGMILVSN